MSNSLNDGLGALDQLATGAVSGTDIGDGALSGAMFANLSIPAGKLAANSVSGNAIAAGGVASGKLIADCVSGNDIKDLSVGIAKLGVVVCPIYTGSPIAGGLRMEVGNTTTAAGSNVWVSYGKAFLAAPKVIVSASKTAGGIYAGSIGAGSFYCESAAASETFNWLAAGSGRA